MSTRIRYDGPGQLLLVDDQEVARGEEADVSESALRALLDTPAIHISVLPAPRRAKKKDEGEPQMLEAEGGEGHDKNEEE